MAKNKKRRTKKYRGGSVVSDPEYEKTLLNNSKKISDKYQKKNEPDSDDPDSDVQEALDVEWNIKYTSMGILALVIAGIFFKKYI